MLERLDDIPWAELTHAYGPASDVPDAIRRLASPRSATRRQALHELGASLCHQGTMYAATCYAVPFLLELLAAPAVEGKNYVLWLLARFHAAGFRHGFDPDPADTGRSVVGTDSPQVGCLVEHGSDWVRQTRAAVHAGCVLYAQLLADPAPGIRAGALELLVGVCAGAADKVERVAGLLRLQLGREHSLVLRIRLIDRLLRTGATDEQTMRQITAIFGSTRDDALRLAAAVALARVQGPSADGEVGVILLQSLISPEARVIERYERGIGSRLSLGSHVREVSLAVRHLGEQRAAQIQDGLLRALVAEGHLPDTSSLPPIGRHCISYRMPDGTMCSREHEGRFVYPPPPVLTLAQALLFLGFGPHTSTRLPPHLRAVPMLSEHQRKAIEGLVECEALWVYAGNMDQLLDLHGLPVTRQDLQTLLAP